MDKRLHPGKFPNPLCTWSFQGRLISPLPKGCGKKETDFRDPRGNMSFTVKGKAETEEGFYIRLPTFLPLPSEALCC